MTEQELKEIMALLEEMGYAYKCGYDVERDSSRTLLPKLISGELKVNEVRIE